MNKEMYYNEYGYMNSMYAGSMYENPNNNKFSFNPDKAVEKPSIFCPFVLIFVSKCV